MFVSRRAWCRESGPPRSREAFGSNPRRPTESNLQILSHGDVPSANAGERDRLCRANRRSGLMQSGCEADKERLQSPNGTRTKAARPIGCKARQVRGTFAGVGSRTVATPIRRSLTSSGVPPKTRTVKSSTMKGASSPCQSAAAEMEPNRERPVRMGRGPLLYSGPRNQRARGAGNHDETGVSHMPDRFGQNVLPT